VLPGAPVSAGYWVAVCIGIPVALALSWLFGRLLQRLDGPLDELARDQASFLDHLPAKRVEVAIGSSAALSLLLELGRKIYLMMQQAFDGHPPVCVYARYDLSVIFLQSKNGDLEVPEDLLARTGFANLTSVFADPALQADVSTDDWPFFYMARRVYPRSYLVMVGLVLVLSVALFASFIAERPRFSQASFFFLGAGFMLVETKGITELGLALGNT
jgi:hypothetical protein